MKLLDLKWGWYVLLIVILNFATIYALNWLNFTRNIGGTLSLSILVCEFIGGTIVCIFSSFVHDNTRHLMYRLSLSTAVGALATCALAFAIFVYFFSGTTC